MGHEVVAITNSADKQRDAQEMGADSVLLVRNDAGQELLDMGGADVILSFSPSMKQNTQLLKGLRPWRPLRDNGCEHRAHSRRPGSNAL